MPTPKIEVWRAATGKPALYPNDPFVVAMVTDDAATACPPHRAPLLDLNDPPPAAAFRLADPARFEYRPPSTMAPPDPPPCCRWTTALARLLARSGRWLTERVETFEATPRPRAGRGSCARRSTCRRRTTARWTATRCAAPTCAKTGTLLVTVAQRIPAGRHVGQLAAGGTAARIFTGAQIPPGADAIVMQETLQARRWATRCASASCRPSRGSGSAAAARMS